MSGEQIPFNFSTPLPSLPQLWTPDDIWNFCDREIIERFAEDSRVERKRVEISQKDLADNLSMWANTNPYGGVIFIGVDKTGKLLGCKHSETEHINRLRTVHRLCSDARHEFKNVSIKNHAGDDDYVIVARVYYRPDKLVETASGDAFIREGDEKRKLTETEKREIRLNKGELDVEMERVNLRFPQDFEIDLLAAYREQYLTKRQLQRRFTLEDVLHMSKLGTFDRREFVPNLACAVLFSNENRKLIPGCFIRVLRYDGVEEKFGHKINSVADRVFEGPLPLQLTMAVNYVESQIRNFTRLGTDGRFATNPEYPKEVWLEALVNATVHRSYNLRHMNIFLKMFEDKLVIESPGSFMPPTTAETVYDTHNPRNPRLMWGLYYFDYVQCAFEGTRRMRASMREANLPDPKFVQKHVGTFQVVVTLENDVEHRRQYVRTEAAPNINPEVYASLSESEKMIVNYLVDRNRVNVTDAGLVIGRDWRETKKILDGLEAKAVIGRSLGKHRSRHRFYYLKKKAGQ
jgi:ATP-dependent DNA helicase RecG